VVDRHAIPIDAEIGCPEHLSQIGVKLGDLVKKGQIIGRSGSTGLAGGDHLHFGMQVDGVQVNPVEWWDAHWIKDRVRPLIP